jgi:hypothetical protein
MGKSQYPRGVPYRPPESGDAPQAVPPESGPADAALTKAKTRPALSLEARLLEAQAREAQLRRWMLVVALGTVSFVVVAVGVGVFFVNRALRQHEQAAPATSPAPPRDTQPKETRPLVVNRPGEPPLPPKEPPPPAAGRDRSLEAVGGLSAAHLYQTYLNIGMLADATENDVYTEDDARKLLDTIMAWMDNVDKQLARLLDTSLDADDQKKVLQVRGLTGHLRVQGKELRAYWDTPESDMAGKKDHEMKFHKAREDAWTGIRELLGIKDE